MFLAKTLFRFVFSVTVFWSFQGNPVAAERISLIRDTEIENTIRAYSAPLFEEAGLNIAFVKIHLIKDRRLNAFIAGGQQIFVHTGLLTRSENAGQIIGVLSHEIGHIAGGHLARLNERLENASTQSIIAMVLAVPAAVITGESQVGAAILSGGTTATLRSVLQYSREMETAADQAALSYLERRGMSALGMLEFFELLAEQEALYSSDNDPYLRTHPITRERIEFVRNHVNNSKYSDRPLSLQLDVMHRRMRGKLNGFIDPPERTLQFYAADDTDIEALYARAIAHMRQNDIDQALDITNRLLIQSPSDPFILELKGDILRSSGRIKESILPYQEALTIIPWAALIRVNLAQAQLELNDDQQTRDALINVKEALRYEPKLVQAWRLAAVSYGRLKDFGNLALALAEQSVAQGRISETRRHVKQAMKLLTEGSPGWLRAQDIGNMLSE